MFGGNTLLTFPITRKWYSLIISGEKKEEYRELSPFYLSRLGKLKGEIIELKLLNGYSSKSPYVIIKCKVETGEGLQAWGATAGKYYFVLKILEILEINKGG